MTETEKESFLSEKLGPKQLDYSRSVILTILYTTLFMVGFSGNLLTVVIILCNSYMRIPPNFFLLSLAIADIITLLGGNINHFMVLISRACSDFQQNRENVALKS